jgi:hypothetical protein
MEFRKTLAVCIRYFIDRGNLMIVSIHALFLRILRLTILLNCLSLQHELH